MTGDSILDRNANHRNNVANLRHAVDALDRWEAWANGERATIHDTRDLCRALRSGLEHDWLNDDPRSQLADIVRMWAEGPNLQFAELAPEVERVEPRHIEVAPDVPCL